MKPIRYYPDERLGPQAALPHTNSLRRTAGREPRRDAETVRTPVTRANVTDDQGQLAQDTDGDVWLSPGQVQRTWTGLDIPKKSTSAFCEILRIVAPATMFAQSRG